MTQFRLFIFIFLFMSFSLHTSNNLGQTPAHTILISTSFGDMKVIIYEETPLHSDNFIKLAREGYFDDQLFHRVINNFMIQSGDPQSKNARPGEMLGLGDPGYTIPAEIYPNLYHKKGSLAAARQGDNINPERASSGSQFYIVQGTVFTDHDLDIMEQKHVHIKFTEEQRKVYTTIGGTPHLDYIYTVFGEVISGLEVLDSIASVPTDKNNRPLEDISIKMKVLH